MSFKDNPNSGVYGIAKFIKGINQKYRIVETQIQKSVFSSIIQSYKFEINDKRYIAIIAYNLTEEVSSYGVKYATYSEPGYLSNNMEA